MKYPIENNLVDPRRSSFRIIENSHERRRVVLCILIITVMVTTSAFSSVFLISSHGSANEPGISGTNLSYQAHWDLNTASGLLLSNISLANGSAILSTNEDLTAFSGQADFSAGIFNGTILSEADHIIPGFISDYNFTTGTGWLFTDNPQNNITSYYEPAENSGIIRHTSNQVLAYRELDIALASGSGTGLLINDIVSSDDAYYSLDKNENMTISKFNTTGLDGQLNSITVYGEYATSNVYTGNYSMRILNTSSGYFGPINITPMDLDPPLTDLVRYDVLNQSIFSVYDTWSKLSDMKLYWENNCAQAAKNVMWDRIWLNVTYYVNKSMSTPGNTGNINYSFIKNYITPNAADEVVLNLNYFVDTARNLMSCSLKIELDKAEILSVPLAPEGTISTLTLDISALTDQIGIYNLSFQINFNYSSPLLVDCKIDFLDIQVIPKQSTFVSEVFDPGKNVVWKQIAWLEHFTTTAYSVDVETRTGDSPDPKDASWSSWSLPLTDKLGSDMGSPSSRYLQYRINFQTNDIVSEPAVEAIQLNYTYYRAAGVLETAEFSVFELTQWSYLSTNYSKNGGGINFEYSINSGSSWVVLPANGSLVNAPVISNNIMVRINFTTADTLISPMLFDFSISYVTKNHQPTRPQTEYPSHRSFIGQLQPEFNWSKSADADAGDPVTYTLYYSTDPVFSQDVNVVNGLTTDNYIPAASLDDDSLYYWYVEATDSHGSINSSQSSRSSVFITNTENDPPTIPQLVDPSNNSVITHSNFIFDWTDSSDPDFGDTVSNYTLEISEDPLFTTNKMTISSITKSAYSMDILLGNNTFYWRVEAVDTNGMTSGFQYNPNVFRLDVPYPEIYPMIDDITTGEDFPYNLNLYNHIELKYHSENLSWNLVDVDTSLFNWEIDNNSTLIINPVANTFGNDDFEIELYHSGILRDTQDVKITVQSINDPPIITPAVPESLFRTIEGTSISVNLDNFATDYEDSNDDLYWSVDNYNHAGYSVRIESNPDILYLDTSYNSSGQDYLTLTLWDSEGDIDTQQVMVNITPLNHPPVIKNLPDLVLHFNENYYFDLRPYILDQDTRTEDLTVMDNNEYVGFNPTLPLVAIFKFPEMFMGELIHVRFTVNDGQLSDFDEISVYVSDNDIPQKKPIPDITFKEDTVLNYALDLDDYFYDTDGDLLDYYVFGNEMVTVTIKNDHSVDFEAIENWFGQETVIFRAQDSLGALVEDSIEITVKPVNDPPEVLLSDLDIMEEIYTSLDLSPFINDIDTALDDIDVGEDSDFITVDRLNLTFYYPKGVDFDIFTLSVSDGMDYVNITVHVVIHPNKPPVIDEIPDLILHYDYGYKFNLQPYINDPDNESEDLDLLTDSTYITIDSHEPLLIIINYPESFLGQTISIKIDVSDGILTTIGYFKVKVSDDWAPELIKPIPNLVFMEDSMNMKVLNLNSYFEDKDNEVLSFKVKSEMIEVTIHENGYVDITAEKNWYGFESVTFGAIDEHGAFSEDTIRIQFGSVNDPPVILDIPNQNSRSNNIWTLDLRDFISDLDTPEEDLAIETDSKYIEVSGFTLFFNYPENVTYEEVLITVSDGELTASKVLVIKLENKEADSKMSFYDSMPLISLVIIILSIIIVFYTIYRSRKKDEKKGRYSPGREPMDFAYGYRSMYRPTYPTIDHSVGVEPTPGLGANLGRDNNTDSALKESKGEGAASVLARELQSPGAIFVSTSNSYLIEEPKPDKTFEVFNLLIKKGLDGLCITRTHPNLVRSKYGVKDHPIIWLTSSKQVKNESYIPPPALSRISLVVSNFLQKKNQGVILLEGFEFLLNRDDFKTVLKLIHFLNDLVITNKSVLLIPVDPKILDESNLHLLERDCFIVKEKDKISISNNIEIGDGPKNT